MNRQRIRGLAPIALLAVAGLLVGCADDDGAETGATQVATPAPVSTTPAGSEGSATGGALEAARTAIATAEGAHPGRAVELDHEDTGEWKVDVLSDDTLTEVRISADGATVVQAEQPEPVDGDDPAEFAALTVPLADAIAAAVAQVPGTIDEVSVEDYTNPDGGATGIGVKVELFTDAGAKQSVFVDAGTGQVVFTMDGD